MPQEFTVTLTDEQAGEARELAALAKGDPAHDRIAAAIRSITGLVTGPPNLIGFDFCDLRAAFIDGGRAVFGQGEAEGPDRAIRAADAAMADIRRQLSQRDRRRR